jgi:hypothetical protein
MKSPSEQYHKPTCFVIMPFNHVKSLKNDYDTLNKDILDTIFHLYKDILEKEGYSVYRSDTVGDILAEIVYSLDSADLVLADLTGLNPNVMYELGLRHGFTKKTILTSQDLSELPFDLNKYFCLQYGWKTKKEKDELSINIQSVLKKIKTTPGIKFGPVHSYLGEKINIDTKFKNDFLNHLDALAADITNILSFFRIELAILLDKYPESINRLDIGVEVDKNKIPESVLNSPIQTSKAFNIKSIKYPAIEYNIARNKIISFLNIDSSMSSFNIVLRNTYRYLNTEHTLNTFLGTHQIFGYLQWDLQDLREAIDQEKFGAPLNLRSIEVLKIIEDISSKRFTTANHNPSPI